eukprot:9495451-Pyramimonas_sp.AAC.1
MLKLTTLALVEEERCSMVQYRLQGPTLLRMMFQLESGHEIEGVEHVRHEAARPRSSNAV